MTSVLPATRDGGASRTRRQQHLTAAVHAGLATADWPALGTTAQLVLTDPGSLAPAQVIVERRLAEIDRAASRFRADSELSRLNGADGEWVEVSPLFASALKVARHAAESTDGLVDPTVGAALIDLGYDRTFVQVPSEGPPLTLGVQRAPGWWQIEIDDIGERARLPRGVRIDLGATAKALAADLCAAAVARVLRCGALVSLGGDIAVAGDPPTGGWPVSVTDRSDLELPTGGHAQTVAMHGGGLATSSIGARKWQRGGSLLHHLIDPRSGLPTAGPWRTVSVAAPTCVLANTASTAAVIIGATAPGWLAARGLAARLVAHDGLVTHVGPWPAEGERR